MKLLKLLEILGTSSGNAILLCGVPLFFSSTMQSPQPAHRQEPFRKPLSGSAGRMHFESNVWTLSAECRRVWMQVSQMPCSSHYEMRITTLAKKKMKSLPDRQSWVHSANEQQRGFQWRIKDATGVCHSSGVKYFMHEGKWVDSRHHSVPSQIPMEDRRSQLRWSCRFTLRLAVSHCRIVPSQLQEYAR